MYMYVYIYIYIYTYVYQRMHINVCAWGATEDADAPHTAKNAYSIVSHIV